MPPVARIQAANGKVGTGVLFERRLLLTAAHVVHRCEEAKVLFPGAHRELDAIVEWRGPWEQPGDHGDVAVLALRVPEAPGRIAPCQFADVHALRPGPARSSFRVRTFGYPAGVGAQGIHTHGTTNADLVLDGEWLQVDAVEGQFPIRPGISGGPVWLEATGEVVGIMTDSLPEYGFRIAKMLPLATIRRYWEELHDYLPVASLDDRRMLTELRQILTGAETRSDPARILLTALPSFYENIQAGFGGVPVSFDNAWQAALCVEEDAGSRDELWRFLRVLAADLVDLPRRRTLASWIMRWFPLGATDLPPPSQISSIVVRADHVLADRSKFEVSLTAVVAGLPARPLGPFEVTRDEICEKVQSELPGLVRLFLDDDWWIEFNVPASLMNEPFDEWKYQEPGVSVAEPLRSSTLIVRDVQRPTRGRAFARAERRWRAMRGQNGTLPQPIHCDEGYDSEEFRNMLDAARTLGALAFEAAPKDDWLEAALEQGVPIMIWRRDKCALTERHATHGDFLIRLASELGAVAPEKVSANVANLRREAWLKENAADDKHLGRRLTLFWDDPARACILDEPPYAMGEGDG